MRDADVGAEEREEGDDGERGGRVAHERAGRADERARDGAERERSVHLLGGRAAHHHRRSGAMGLVNRRDVRDVVQEPTTQPWGNRSLLFRDPDGNLVNLFTPVGPAAIAKYNAQAGKGELPAARASA